MERQPRRSLPIRDDSLSKIKSHIYPGRDGLQCSVLRGLMGGLYIVPSQCSLSKVGCNSSMKDCALTSLKADSRNVHQLSSNQACPCVPNKGADSVSGNPNQDRLASADRVLKELHAESPSAHSTSCVSEDEDDDVL